MPKRVMILGVPVDAVTMAETKVLLRSLARSGIGHHVMTPNPEMLVAAHRDPAFSRVLSRSSLNIPDGVGLLFASRFLGSPLPERVAGVDLVEELATMPELQPIFFLGAADHVAERCAAALSARHPEMIIAGSWSGSPALLEEAAILTHINTSGARTLLVAYGAPAQDLWIDRVLTRLPSVRLAIGVGGTFDFLAGTRIRAPRFLRALGLEWCWRLVQEPSRLRRILTAVIVFPFLVLTQRHLSRGLHEAARTE